MSAQAAPARPVGRPVGPVPRTVARPATRPADRPGGRAAPRPRARGPQPQATPSLRVLARPEVTPRRVGFALTCTALLGALMVALLLLNVAISGNAFTLSELGAQRGVLADRQQSLEHDLQVASSPGGLADRAGALGMVPAPAPVVLQPDGTGAPPLDADG
ncbi:hypothetical protein [Aquipuribacter sp. SD81]|uniref:hypothetical protein n=1 Tax=Aquipuribacter sp. SD81 TaxID=3127703 RepID=UPI003016A008